MHLTETVMTEDDGLVDVLFIGQDESLADMYRFKLEMDGYRVRIVTSLRAWSAAAATPPDLVFLDIDRPDGDGVAELQRLRAHRALKSVPAILLAAETPEELSQRGLALTAQDYLLPVRRQALRQTITTWSAIH